MALTPHAGATDTSERGSPFGACVRSQLRVRRIVIAVERREESGDGMQRTTAAVAAAVAVLGLVGASAFGSARSGRAARTDADFKFDAAPVLRTATTTTYAGRFTSHELRRSGAIVYTTRPYRDRRRADFTIYLTSGTLRGYTVPVDALPAGEDPMITGTTGVVTGGTGRFHGIRGYVVSSDDSGPGAPPTVTADGVHHQVLDICFAPARTASKVCLHS